MAYTMQQIQLAAACVRFKRERPRPEQTRWAEAEKETRRALLTAFNGNVLEADRLVGVIWSGVAND